MDGIVCNSTTTANLSLSISAYLRQCFTNSLSLLTMYIYIHSLRKVLSTRVSQGECLAASTLHFLDRFTQPKNNSGSFIFVLSQLFWGEQCATVLPIHNRMKREAILLFDWFSRFLYGFGRKYVIKNTKVAPKGAKIASNYLKYQ